MRTYFLGLGILSVLGVCGLVAVSSWGQGPEPTPAPRPSKPQVPAAAAASRVRNSRDLTKMPLPQRQLYLSAQSGMKWLLRANQPDGRFLYGLVPALRQPLPEDNYVHQVAAAFAVARAARFFHDDQAAAIARQALLTLLLETEQDTRNPKMRRPMAALSGANRLATAGWLVMAIHDLPAPGADLLQQSEELCQFIRSQQRADGSLCYTDDPADPKGDRALPEGVKYFPGPALYGLVRSLQHSKADWKLDVVRKARAYYQEYWRAHKNTEMVPWHSAAYAEAYRMTREAPLAACVLEMNDWLCTLQYKQLDPRHMLWIGGFRSWEGGTAATVPPDIRCAGYMEGLAAACQVARQEGEVQRFKAYQEALENCGQFLTGLQYTTANTQHFAEWYRTEILGAFHPSHRDGNLRIDYTQAAVCGLIRYLADVADLGQRP